MTILYVLPTFFLCIFIFFAIDKSLKNKKTLIRNPKPRLNYNFNSWKFEEYTALSIIMMITLLCALILISSLGTKIEKTLPQIIFILTCTSSTLLAFKNLKLDKLYKKHSSTFKLTATFITIMLTLKSSAEADATLIHFTNIDPGQFPTAQKIMTFTGLILNWLILAIYAFLAIYAGYFIAIIYSDNKATKTKRNRSYSQLCTNFEKSYSRERNLGYITVVGLCFTIAIISSALGGLRPNLINGILKELFVYASFHLEPDSCEITAALPGSKVALISDKRAVLASPDKELTYIFTTEECKIQPVKLERTLEGPTLPSRKSSETEKKQDS